MVLFAKAGTPKTHNFAEAENRNRKRRLPGHLTGGKWHPDRFASKSAAEQEKASEQFKIISDALDVLTDPVRRKLWDQGYDRKEIEERAEMEKQRGQHRGHGGGFGGGGFPGGFPGGFGGFG